MSAYRDNTRPPIHRVLDATCRRCSMWGHKYIYFPAHVDAGPLCRRCFIVWRGDALHWRFGVVSVGRVSWPVEDRNFGPGRSYSVADADGEDVEEEELRQPSINADWGCYEEKTLLSRLVGWFS